MEVTSLGVVIVSVTLYIILYFNNYQVSGHQISPHYDDSDEEDGDITFSGDGSGGTAGSGVDPSESMNEGGSRRPFTKRPVYENGKTRGDVITSKPYGTSAIDARTEFFGPVRPTFAAVTVKPSTTSQRRRPTSGPHLSCASGKSRDCVTDPSNGDNDIELVDETPTGSKIRRTTTTGTSSSLSVSTISTSTPSGDKMTNLVITTTVAQDQSVRTAAVAAVLPVIAISNTSPDSRSVTNSHPDNALKPGGSDAVTAAGVSGSGGGRKSVHQSIVYEIPSSRDVDVLSTGKSRPHPDVSTVTTSSSAGRFRYPDNVVEGGKGIIGATTYPVQMSPERQTLFVNIALLVGIAFLVVVFSVILICLILYRRRQRTSCDRDYVVPVSCHHHATGGAGLMSYPGPSTAAGGGASTPNAAVMAVHKLIDARRPPPYQPQLNESRADDHLIDAAAQHQHFRSVTSASEEMSTDGGLSRVGAGGGATKEWFV